MVTFRIKCDMIKQNSKQDMGGNFMAYYVDLEKVDLKEYKEMLMAMQLVKSRMLIREDIDSRFETFEADGIKNVKQLRDELKKKRNWKLIHQEQELI